MEGAVLVFLGVIFLFIVVLNRYQHDKWEARPTLEEYLAKYPECKTKRGIRCATCGSGSIKNWGVLSAEDDKRVFICNHCGENLYRSGSRESSESSDWPVTEEQKFY